MSDLTSILSFIGVSLLTYIVADNLIEIFLRSARGVGRPTRRFNFWVLIFSLIVNQFTNDWLQKNISAVIVEKQLNPDFGYIILIVICYYLAKKQDII